MNEKDQEMEINGSPADWAAMHDSDRDETGDMTPAQMSGIRAEDGADADRPAADGVDEKTITPSITAAAAPKEKSPSAEKLPYNMDGEEKKAESPLMKHAFNEVDGEIDFFDEEYKVADSKTRNDTVTPSDAGVLQPRTEERQSAAQENQLEQSRPKVDTFLRQEPIQTSEVEQQLSQDAERLQNELKPLRKEQIQTSELAQLSQDAELLLRTQFKHISSPPLDDFENQQAQVQQQNIFNDSPFTSPLPQVQQPLLVEQSTNDSPFDWLEGATQQTMKRRLPQSTSINRSEFGKAFDVESQSKEALSQQESSPSRTQERSVATRGAGVSTRVLFNKIVMAIITDIDDETLRHPETESILIVITHLKEAMLGIVIAFLLVSFVLFLDHRFILGLPTARNFRRATFALMNDKETLAYVEEYAGLKFMNMEKYTANMQEIGEVGNRTKLGAQIMKRRESDLIKLKKEILQYDIPALMSKVGLDRFCDTCLWAGQLTCDMRVQALQAKYDTPRYTAMLSAMKKEVCIKSIEQVEKERKEKVLEDEILKYWEGKNEKDWCSDCDWDSKTTCQERSEYLTSRYGVPSHRAKAKVMIEEDNCRNSGLERENEKLAKFCKECIWDNDMTCQQRVEYLMNNYQDSNHAAMVSAIKTPACVNKD